MQLEIRWVLNSQNSIFMSIIVTWFIMLLKSSMDISFWFTWFFLKGVLKPPIDTQFPFISPDNFRGFFLWVWFCWVIRYINFNTCFMFIENITCSMIKYSYLSILMFCLMSAILDIMFRNFAFLFIFICLFMLAFKFF